MNAEQLRKIYRETLSDIQWEGKTSPERIAEYKRVWADDDELIKHTEEKPHTEIMSELGEYWFIGLKNHLLESNPGLSAESKKTLIINIDSYEQYTGSRKLEDNTPVILIDAGLMKFIWVMNKAYIYGTDEGKFSKNYLTCMTLLSYALYLKKPEKLREQLIEFTTPPTPPHSDEKLFTVLASETMIHEAFVVAHEIAHIELGHLLKGQEAASAVCPKNIVSPLTTELVSDITTIENELAADNLAVELCMRAFNGSDKDNALAILTSIYQVSRYFLWLEMVLQLGDGEHDLPWASRHFHLRRKIEDTYGDNMFIIDHLDWLERNMESGALYAAEFFEEIWNTK